MPTNPGQALQTGEACQPFRDHLAQVRSADPVPTSWSQVQSGFLQAMAAFDAAVVLGDASEGERQNGKGDYFNDLLAILLEAGSGKVLHTRRRVDGLVFPNHNLDVTYPPTGVAEVLVEAKMMGTPRHSGSPRQGAVGRPGQADFLKRAKELGFKALDLKAGFGLMITQQGGHQPGPAGDLAAWSKASRPKTYMLLGVRVVGESDLRALITTALQIDKLMDGVGLFAYTNDHLDEPARSYQEAAYPNLVVPRSVELRSTLHSISNILEALPPAAAADTDDLTVLPTSVPPVVDGEG